MAMVQRISDSELTREQAIAIFMYEMAKGENASEWFSVDEVFAEFYGNDKSDADNNK